MTRNSPAVDVWHGPWVATRNNFFVEGAWSGDYGEDAIDQTFLMGSGGRVRGGNLILATPSHTVEPLYALKNHDGLFVSNSIVFLLCRAGDAPHPSSLRYSAVLASAVKGLHSYPRHLPTRDGHRIRLFNYCNVVVRDTLAMEERPKPSSPDFATFGEYRGFLAHHVGRIAANARDTRRHVTYEPVAMLSSGFDSPACAVFARECGCREAITFARPRGAEKGSTADSGLPIAERLGMNAVALDRTDYLRQPGHRDEEFFDSPSAAMHAPVADRMEARLVFSGHHGFIWERAWHHGAEYLARTDPSGHGLGEFRLRVGWIHMIVPYIGCTSYSAINRISRSAEMKPWSSGTSYDKPIPTRICESAGIERSLFGRVKRAVAVVPRIEGGYEAWMTASSYRDFKTFCAERWNSRLALQHRLLEHLKALNEWHAHLNERVETRLTRRHSLNVALPYVIPRDLRISRFGITREAALLFHWAVERLTDRYNDRA